VDLSPGSQLFLGKALGAPERTNTPAEKLQSPLSDGLLHVTDRRTSRFYRNSVAGTIDDQ